MNLSASDIPQHPSGDVGVDRIGGELPADLGSAVAGIFGRIGDTNEAGHRRVFQEPAMMLNQRTARRVGKFRSGPEGESPVEHPGVTIWLVNPSSVVRACG